MKAETVDRIDVLYDKRTLKRLNDSYGPEGKATESEIKRHVKTSATMYEIRTALRYWFGGDRTRRTSQRIWDNCAAVEAGVHPSEVEA